jgi:hypothetical protein
MCRCDSDRSQKIHNERKKADTQSESAWQYFCRLQSKSRSDKPSLSVNVAEDYVQRPARTVESGRMAGGHVSGISVTNVTGMDPSNMVARGGIEPPTRGFSVLCLNRAMSLT